MTKLWQRDEQVDFAACVFSDDHIADEMRDYINPACTDNLLLWGVPGTGKSVLVKAIASERIHGAAFEDGGVGFLDCKNKQDAQRLNGKWLDGWFNYAHLQTECPILILDELDELSEAQQRELTAFVNRSNQGKLKSMIMGTTNVNVFDKKQCSKSFSDALLSRMNGKFEIRRLFPEQLLPVAQVKLKRAGVSIEDKVLLDVFEKNLPMSAKRMDFREVQTVVNKLIRRSSQLPIDRPPKPKFKIV
jgi:replication-associated recombination protein RarA